MNTFQTIVVPLAIALAVMEIVTWRNGGRRVHGLKSIVWVCFAGAVYQPNLVQRLAGAANIGRGADLLLYGLAVFVLLTTFHFLNNFEIQRRQVTLLVRSIAISNPLWPAKSDSNESVKDQ